MASDFGPRCPNHRVCLVDCHHGIGICPISDCRFSYTGNEGEQERKLKVNSLGQMVLGDTYKVIQIDGEDRG